MRRENLLLSVVVLVAVLCSGLLAGHLRVRQDRLAVSRVLVSQAPLAGFHKFASDIYWMLFLQYAGANQITSSNSKEFDRRVRQIINMDPDFMRIYYLGALMLAPVDPKAALEILDQGIKNPRLREGWRLPLLAGQLIMRRQWDHYYQNQRMDFTQVEKAREYFRAALASGAPVGLALNSYIRVDAALKDNGRPREINELESWFQLYKDQRLRGRGRMGGRSPISFDADGTGATASPDDGPPFSLTDRILSLMRVAKTRYPEDPQLTAMIKDIRTVVFGNVRFNELTMEPIDLTRVNSFSGLIEQPRAKPYVVALSPHAGFMVMGFTAQARSGTLKVTVRVNERPVAGLENIVVTTKRGIAYAAGGSGVLNPGQTLDLVVSAPEGDPTDLAYTLEVYQGR